MALTTRTITAHYPSADLTPATGYVELVPTATLASLADNTIVWPAPVRAGLDELGNVRHTVLATGTGNLLPTGWVYRITEHINGAARDAWLAEIPAGDTPLDLADISPLVAQPGLLSYVLLTAVGQESGPAGPLVNGLVPAEQIPAAGGADPAGTAAAAVAAHTAAADPHADRAFATSAVSTHAAAADPHSDRAFTTSAVSAHTAASDPHGDRAAATAALSAHDTDTTTVHGIADTSALETSAGATAKIAAHVAAVDPHGDRSAASAALTSHENDTTSVHGIADTTALETSAGATAKVSAHAAASDPHGDRAFATSAVSTHSAATTSVHGIANTAALETTTGAATKVSTHAGAADPHADRAFTTSAVSTHSGAADPHADRAFTTSAIATHSGAADPHGDRAYADTRAPLAIIGTVTSDQAAITGTTLTDVAGLGLAIPGAGTFDFEYYISYTGSVGGSNTTATNPNAQLNGPAVSFAGYVIEMQISNTTNNIFAKTTLGSAQAPATNGISTALNPYTVRIRGRIIATGAGTLQPQIARAVGTFTGDIVVKAGSHATARKVA